MARFKGFLSALAAFLILSLTACGGGGGGSSADSPTPPLADNSGVWVGTWSGSGNRAPLVVEMHQSNGALTGYATIANGADTVGRMVNQPLIGVVNGASIQMGVVGEVDYTGTLSGTSASGTFSDTGTGLTGTWRIDRLIGPFADGVAPTYSLDGSWDASIVSSMGLSHDPADLTITHSGGSITFTGTFLQGKETYTILAGRISGNTMWYVMHPDRNTMIVSAGSMPDAGHASGDYVTYDVSTSMSPVDRGTWSAVPH